MTCLTCELYIAGFIMVRSALCIRRPFATGMSRNTILCICISLIFSHFPSCFGDGVTNLNQPPSSFLLPPHYCGLGTGSIPFRAIANNKQCEMRGLFMSLVIHYWIGDVQDSQGVYTPLKWPVLCRVGRYSIHSLTSLISKLCSKYS